MIINIIQAKGNKDRQVMLAPQLIPLLESYYREYESKVYVLNTHISHNLISSIQSPLNSINL